MNGLTQCIQNLQLFPVLTFPPVTICEVINPNHGITLLAIWGIYLESASTKLPGGAASG